jgi:hypothetical protein
MEVMMPLRGAGQPGNRGSIPVEFEIWILKQNLNDNPRREKTQETKGKLNHL